MESSPLPVLLVVAWSLLWWRGSRRIRLRFVGLALLVAAVGVVLGLLALARASPVLCSPDHCAAAGGANADMYAMSGIVGLIFGNSLLALIVAVALGVLTLVVELLLAGGRTTLGRTSATGPDKYLPE